MNREPILPGLPELLETASPAGLGPEPREDRMDTPALTGKIRTVLAGTALPRLQQKLIEAALLLWHDHLDEAHGIVQSIDNPDGSLIHGILHRREPDYSNAKYWFRKAGSHSIFPALAENSRSILSGLGLEVLSTRMLRDGKWDASAFADLCRDTRTRADPAGIKACEEVQREEFRLILSHLLGH